MDIDAEFQFLYLLSVCTAQHVMYGILSLYLSVTLMDCVIMALYITKQFWLSFLYRVSCSIFIQLSCLISGYQVESSGYRNCIFPANLEDVRKCAINVSSRTCY